MSPLTLLSAAAAPAETEWCLSAVRGPDGAIALEFPEPRRRLAPMLRILAQDVAGRALDLGAGAEMEAETGLHPPARWRATALPDPAAPRRRALVRLQDATARQARTLAGEGPDPFRLALEATRDGIIDWDLATGRVWYSPRWKALLGYQDYELANSAATWKALILPQDQHLGLRLVREHYAGNRDFGTTIRFRHKDGSVRHLMVRGISVRGPDGRPGRLVAAYTDVTPLLEAQAALHAAKEEAERASRAKSVFLGAMSHELRTPLNAIIGFSELIASEALGPVGNGAYADYARDILAGGQRLLAVVNDILDLTRLEAAECIERQRVDAPALVRAAVQGAQASAQARGLHLDLRPAAGLPPIEADPHALARALARLVSNAIQFTPEGGRVTLGARTEDGAVLIEIADTGIGMAPEEVPRALEAFTQLEHVLARRHQGIGLGLAAVRRTVELHGAAMEIDTAPGRGTRVTLRFPALGPAAQAG
ncbi:PAS domain-containing sensor histidine kinase [Arenibaculum pallidiluteum]|uniref:PAS domain-containing sensor histidine kinase n=1 Tax=Arenibaculum pallidiluteum TaxID=2812559 RepID=UPI001A9779A5|nr:ATP-binding protein [Arenibaculum pallidiluteum]